MKKLLVVVSLFLAFCFPAVAETTVYFVDVGQGDSTLVQSSGETLVIDTGPPEARAALDAQLQACGVDRIDVLILTHPHEDHDGSFGYLVNSYEIGTLYMPVYADDEEDYGGLLRQAVAQGTQIRHPSVGDQFTVGDATTSILSAADPVLYSDDKNLWSIVMKIEDCSTSVIVMGDAEDINEYAMIDVGLDLDADILRVGHHGSHTSTSGALLDAVTPDVAVISCGANNPYGHPHRETLDALYDRQITVLRTDIDGTITVTIDNTAYTISTEK
jgi:competence protein ComEC